MQNAKLSMRKKAIFFILVILLTGFILRFSPDARNQIARKLDEFSSKIVPQKNIPSESEHPHLMRQLDRYLPHLVKFELISKIHMPVEQTIHQALFDSLHIEPDTIQAFIQKLDSLNSSEIKIFYEKFQTVLDTIKMPDSIRIHIRKELENKLRNPLLPGGKP